MCAGGVAGLELAQAAECRCRRQRRSSSFSWPSPPPRRRERSLARSRKVIDATFGSSTTASMIAKLRVGKRLATSSTSRAIKKPDREDLVVLFVREHRQVRLVVGRRARLQHCDIGVQLLFRVEQTAVRAVVERPVAEAARVGDHRQPDVPALGNPLGWLQRQQRRRAASCYRARTSGAESPCPSTRSVRVGLSPFAKRERMNLRLARGAAPLERRGRRDRLAAALGREGARPRCGTLGTTARAESDRRRVPKTARLSYATSSRSCARADDAECCRNRGASPGARPLRLWSLEMPVRRQLMRLSTSTTATAGRRG